MILWKKLPLTINVDSLWKSKDINEWTTALNRYYFTLSDNEYYLEKELENLNINDIENMNSIEFYEFLYEKYFVWKYNGNFLNNKLKSLSVYKQDDRLDELLSIKNNILNANPLNIKSCLMLVNAIDGVGIAGASGLLALLYPEFFGTVDIRVVESLKLIQNFQYSDFLNNISNPKDLTLDEGYKLIKIMREKSQELNNLFNPKSKEELWTPRKIDMILWNQGRGICSFDR